MRRFISAGLLANEKYSFLLLLLDPGVNGMLAGDHMLPPDRTPKPAGSQEAVTGSQTQVDTEARLPSPLSSLLTLG